MRALDLILLIGAGTGAFYHALTAVWLRRWIGGGEKTQPLSARPAVTFFRPVKRGVPRLHEKLGMLVSAGAAGDQFILGADDDSDVDICEVVRREHPDRDISVVRCAPSGIANPKIAKLVQMTPQARHEHWIVSDSEAMFEEAFVEKFCAEWMTRGAAGISAGYRFTGGLTWPQRLDHASILVTLWPGLAAARQFGKVRFFLGACMGMKKSDMEAVGGWKRFGDFLAEDNRLGAALAARGEVLLSAQVMTLDSDPMTLCDYFRHQHRMAVTYRVSDAPGWFAMVVTHGVGAALMLVLLGYGDAWRWIVLGAMLAVRLATAAANASQLKFSMRGFVATVMAASFAEPFFWLSGWLSSRVRWGGKQLKLTREGRIIAPRR